MVLHAPAKVNLHLEIRGLLPDGYHEILSVVHSIPLFDSVHVRSLKAQNSLTVHCDPPLGGKPNIALTAAKAFASRCRVETGIEIRIEKRIPVGAGLGGGSSDAAAVLSGLNSLFSFPLSEAELHELAAKIGSDVPFFLNGSAALMSGRGEIIRALRPRADLFVVLVDPGFPVSTARAYDWWDAETGEERRSVAAGQLQLQFEHQPPISWTFFNSFQRAVERRYPLIGRIREDLEQAGADLAVMSGSGSSVVGIYADAETARAAHRRVRAAHPRAWLLVPLQSVGFTD